jgi:hypothetical protein
MSDTGATGTDTYLKFSSTVLSTNYRTFSISDQMGLVDQSAGSDTGSTYLTTLRDGSMSTTIKHKAGDTALWAALAPGTEATLEWGEEGTAAGKPKHTVNAIVANRQQSASYNDLIVVDLTFQFSSDAGVTDGTY